MSFRLLTISLLLFFLMSPVIKAGDIKTIRGEYTYHSPLNEPPAVAQEKAIREAQLEALKIAFPVTLSEHISAVSNTLDGHTVNSSLINSESEIIGEWIGNIKEPEIKVTHTEHATLYHVKVYGEARVKEYNRIAVDCRLLCNGTDPEKDRLRGEMFYEGDEMYVYFNSPVDGWLAIYLVDDDENKTTQKLVPYDGQNISSYPIKANTEYLFFSKRTAEPEYVKYVTRMVMGSRKRIDFNMLYVIFSPTEFTQVFTKPYNVSIHKSDDIPQNLMPHETTRENFDKWLRSQRRNNAYLQPIRFDFSVSKQ